MSAEDGRVSPVSAAVLRKPYLPSAIMLSVQAALRQGHAQARNVDRPPHRSFSLTPQHSPLPALALEPPKLDEDIVLALAHKEYTDADYKQALEHCMLVHDSNPTRTDTLLLLGAIYYQLHDFDMCIKKNEEAIRIDPKFAECYGNMANAWKEKGNLDLAINYYLIAIELRPSFCDAWSNLASAYMRKGRLHEAAQCCRQALSINPNLVDAHSNLGNLLKAQGLTQHAYTCYVEALRIQPTFAIAWSNLAGLFMEAGDYQKALTYYKEAIRLKPNFSDAHLNQGNVLKAIGRPQEAIMCYQKAIQLRPDYAIAYGARLRTLMWNVSSDCLML